MPARKPPKRPAVTADDRALAEQLYIAFHCPDAGPATEGIAKVLSALHERAVACAAVRVSRELGLIGYHDGAPTKVAKPRKRKP